MNNKSRPFIGHLDSFRHPTSDDWSPNFPRDCVEFQIYLYFSNEGSPSMIRVCVRGADDTGMEADFECKGNSIEVLRYVLNWLNKIPNPVSKAWLLSEGFRRW